MITQISVKLNYYFINLPHFQEEKRKITALNKKKKIEEIEQEKTYQDQFQFIYTNFIDEGSVKQVNLSNDIKKVLAAELQTHFTLKNFLLACSNVEEVLKRPLHDFLRSQDENLDLESVSTARQAAPG